MFTFRCPACGKLHTADGDFAAAFETRCLRCGDAFEVNGELVRNGPASVQAAARVGGPAPAAAPAPAAGSPGPVNTTAGADGVDGEAPLPLAEAGAVPPPEAEPRPRKGRRRRSNGEGAPGPRGDGDNGAAWEEPDGEDDTPPGLHHEPREEPPDEAPAGPWYKRPVVLIGIAAGVLLLLGGGGAAYFLSGGRAKPTKKEVAKTTRPKTTAPAPPPKEAAPKPAAPPPKPGARPDVFIAAPRLAAELTANAGVTDVRYKGKLVEVSGLFDAIEKRSKPLPAGMRAVFRTDGAPVTADLTDSPTDMKTWQRLAPGDPVTVRGVYDAEGLLRHVQLRPETPPADAVYRGKEVELVGYVESNEPADGSAAGFPTIRLEKETFSPVDAECLFRKTDAEAVNRAPPGTLVTLRGTCSGRRGDPGDYHVRLDNCQFVYTSAAAPPVPRVETAQFLREYAEDLRRDLLPPAGSEERLDTPLTVTQLARDLAADPKALEKYGGKVLTVWGLVLRRGGGEVLLEGEDTDKAFRVQCRFSPRNFRLLPKEPTVRVHGLCVGKAGVLTLRLENCEPDDPAAGDKRRLTADYLPHVPGRVLTYDLAVWPADNGRPMVVRQNFVEAEGGVIETVTTHTGTLVGHSLFDPGEQDRWVAQKKTRKVRLPGDVFFHRVHGSFVELGQRALTPDRQVQVVWIPALKVGARLGESWDWAFGNEDHTWTVEKFEEHNGRPAAVVRERVVFNGDDDHPKWVRHVFVRNVGEVERQDTLQLTRKESRVAAEKKLVEGAGAGTPEPSGAVRAGARRTADPRPAPNLPAGPGPAAHDTRGATSGQEGLFHDS